MSAVRRRAADRAMKVAKWVTVGAAALYAAYLVIFNLAFWTGGYEALVNDAQDHVEVRLSHAYTVWPFTVHADRLHLLVDDDAVQIEILARDVVVDFHLSALLERIVHMEGVRGRDYVFRLRRRRLAGDLTEEERDALAPLTDIERGVVREPDPNPDTDLSNNWNVRMDDVDAQFREIWIEGYRFRGDARVVGGFYLRTEDLLRMPRTGVTFAHGAITIDDRAVASLEGGGAVTISEISFRPESEAHPLSAVAIEADAAAAIMDAGALVRHVAKDLRIEGGSGFLFVRGALTGGVVDEGTEVDLDLYDVVASYGSATWRTPVDLHLREDAGELEARLELGGILQLGEGLPAFQMTQALAHGRARASDLRGAPEIVGGTLDVQGGAASVRVVAPKGGPSVVAERVAFSVQWELRRDGTLSGAQAASVKGARIVWGDASYENTEVTARLFARGRAQPAGVVVDDVTGSIIMKGRLGDQAWQGELSVEEAYGSRKMGRVDATLALSTLAPVAAMPPLERRVPDLAEALLDLDDAKAVARAQWEGEDLRFILDELEIDSGTITAWLLVGSGLVRGAIHASLPLISVGVTLADGRSDVTLSPGDDWLRRYLNPGIERPPPPRSALPEPTN